MRIIEPTHGITMYDLIEAQASAMKPLGISPARAATEEGLIELRNWANHVQQAARKFLENFVSEDSRDLARKDPIAFWRRWKVGLDGLWGFVSVHWTDNSSVEEWCFLKEIGEKRGLHFAHAGINAGSAHVSAASVSAWVYDVAYR